MNTPRRRLLQVELLESRELLSVSTLVSEDFETRPVGAGLSGWEQWSSLGGAGFAVTSGPALSGVRGFASTAAISSTTSRTWLASAVQPDVKVTAALLVNALVPAQVLVRGVNLDSSTPSYYAVSVVRGMSLQLVRVNAGSQTVLASLGTRGYFSGEWVRLSLSAVGNQLGVTVQRADTGQYLNATGKWQSAATTAISASDSNLTSGGRVGLGRLGSYGGALNFDDLQVELANASPASFEPQIEPFDQAPVGGLPAGWRQWSSAGGSPFQVTTAKRLSGTAGLLSTAINSQASSRVWTGGPIVADAQVTAALLLDSLAPGRVLLRGRNLDTTAPTYYALEATRGLKLELVRVVNGVSTSLAQFYSASYFSGTWVRLTLYANGSNLRAQVVRPDTGQYLGADGRWQTTQAWAINVNDSLLLEAGAAGLERAARYTGSLYWDDFSVSLAGGDSQPPAVTITTPASGATLSGVQFVRADVVDPLGVNRVEFYLDGVLQALTASAPYEWAFDTAIASNGTHTLTVLAYDPAGNVGRASRTVTTQNDTSITLPDIPRHYSHIRIAELAYTGTPFSATEDQLLRDSVDLLITVPNNLDRLNATAPNTPKVIYSNVSNLYTDLLSDWLSYADVRGVSREGAFYHAAAATPFNGNSPSSQSVNWFSSVLRGETSFTSYTSAARGGAPGGVVFGGTGTALYVGHVDRFRELNVVLQTAAASGWNYSLEYPIAVDAQGRPTAWGVLNPLTDGTLRLTRSGQLVFDAPADWKAASVNGSTRLFYIRFRTTSAGTAPVASSMLGRDYVGANGGTAGTIPAFDAAADLNGDGYLSDTEYSHRGAGKNARFVHESRLFFGSYGQMRFATNPSNLSFREWAADFHLRMMTAYPLAAGVFLDNSGGGLPIPAGVALEPTAAYSNDFAAMVNGVALKIAPRWVLANTVGGGGSADSVISRVGAYFEEFVIRPLAHNIAQFEDVAAMIARRATLRSPAPYAVLDSYPTGGSPTDPRTQLATLAYYYLLQDPATTFLAFFGGYEPATSWTRHWSPAAAYDVGQPLGTWSVFAAGADPSNAALAYRVYQRNYSNALVLYKPLSYGGNTSGSTADNTATTHALGGSYRVLNSDGSLGPIVTSVSLRNGEGAILIKTT